MIGSERVLVEGELRPAVLRVEGDRIAQVWWGTSDPDRIAAAGDDMLGAPSAPAASTWRLGDRVILPGMVDTHVHAAPDGADPEDFTSAARTAAHAGVTTVVDLPFRSAVPTTTVAALRAKQSAARSASAHCDVAFWGAALPGNVDDLERLLDAGAVGFTCFVAGSGDPELPPLAPDELLTVLDRLVRFDGLLAAPAEDATVGTLLDAVRETGARTHLLHVSSPKVLDLLAEAKEEGLPVTAETCHHHLVLAPGETPGGNTIARCCPPVRDRGDQDALWDGLRVGALDSVVGVAGGTGAAARAEGSGLPGFVTLAAAAGSRGVALPEVSRWTSASTAALAGLDRGDRPKGTITEGAAADLFVYDPVAGAVTDTLAGGRLVVSSAAG
ncbi:allantoinase AllB [Promicromonospora xylanilytica]